MIREFAADVIVMLKRSYWPREDTAMNEQIKELPIEVPPAILKLAGYKARARYIALYYYGTKATWDDGAASASFSYYAAYQPLINHPAVAIHLKDMHLGSDDCYPSHALVCDTQANKLLAGPFDAVQELLRSQHAGVNREELATQYVNIFSNPETIGDMQQLGMFEFILGAHPDQAKQTAELLDFLDRYITVELVEAYEQLLKTHDHSAYQAFAYFKARTRAEN